MITLTKTEYSRYKVSQDRKENTRKYTAYDGSKFQSCCKKVRYENLLSTSELGSITELKTFPTFKINMNIEDADMNLVNHDVDFTIDFSYVIGGETIYEIYDTKGKTPSWFYNILSEIKKTYGVTINYVTYDKL